MSTKISNHRKRAGVNAKSSRACFSASILLATLASPQLIVGITAGAVRKAPPAFRLLQALRDTRGVNDVALDDKSDSGGNARFLQIVELYQPAYNAVSREAKVSLCRLALSEWQKSDPPGRFVKTGVDESWLVASDDEAFA
jgi:hypothetical protein